MFGITSRRSSISCGWIRGLPVLIWICWFRYNCFQHISKERTKELFLFAILTSALSVLKIISSFCNYLLLFNLFQERPTLWLAETRKNKL